VLVLRCRPVEHGLGNSLGTHLPIAQIDLGQHQGLLGVVGDATSAQRGVRVPIGWGDQVFDPAVFRRDLFRRQELGGHPQCISQGQPCQTAPGFIKSRIANGK